MNEEKVEIALPKRSIKFYIISIGLSSVALVLIAASPILYARSYSDRVYPGVLIGSYDLGGMTKKDVRNFIENINNRYAKEGIDLTFEINGVKKQIKFDTVLGGENALELVKIDSEAVSQNAIKTGRDNNGLVGYSEPIIIRLKKTSLTVSLNTNVDVLKSELRLALSDYEDKVRNASLASVKTTGEARVVEEKSGWTFEYDDLIEKIKNNFSNLSFKPIALKRTAFSPSVTKEMVVEVLPNLEAILNFGPLSVVYNDGGTSTKNWLITERELAGLVGVRSTDDLRAMFTLDENETKKYLKNVVAPEVEFPAKNARFTMENNKVTEFMSSAPGLEINYEETFKKLNELFEVRNSLILHNTSTDIVELVTKVIEPDIQLGTSNDLGIVEFLGAGSSTFKDSHTRRIQNIAHAVERLNGTVIKPGEEFSATKYAGPFTLENGYLPEAIIKGKTIKDEVGGGMCQIGTTLFRMAMQTGLPITERHNHSLVVSYYADAVNGNPGTDATLYEPILDLKFLNDTGHHMLLLTSIDYKKQLLYFSLWGTKDGRSGGYTRPKVSKWIPAPAETEYIISNVDANGNPLKAEKCQIAYRGAVASFTYTRITPEGEKIDRVFDSYYRPLPKICTVPPSSTPATTTISITQ